MISAFQRLLGLKFYDFLESQNIFTVSVDNFMTPLWKMVLFRSTFLETDLNGSVVKYWSQVGFWNYAKNRCFFDFFHRRNFAICTIFRFLSKKKTLFFSSKKNVQKWPFFWKSEKMLITWKNTFCPKHVVFEVFQPLF